MPVLRLKQQGSSTQLSPIHPSVHPSTFLFTHSSVSRLLMLWLAGCSVMQWCSTLFGSWVEVERKGVEKFLGGSGVVEKEGNLFDLVRLWRGRVMKENGESTSGLVHRNAHGKGNFWSGFSFVSTKSVTPSHSLLPE